MRNNNKEVRDLVAYVFNQPIPKENTEKVLNDAKNLMTWIKPTATGFEDSSGMQFEEFQTRIEDYKPYYGKWDGDTMEKIYNEPAKLPEDFQKRCELHFVAQDGQKYSLDLAPASYRNLCKYIARLDKLGKTARDVITRLFAKEVKGRLPDGTPTCYNLVCFEPTKVVPLYEREPDKILDDDLPF